MPGTRRIPIARHNVAKITPEAVAIYVQMRKLRCECGPYPDPTKWTGRKQCRGCTAWWDLHSKLADLCPHKPWEWPLLNPPTKYPDFDRATGMFTTALRRQLGLPRMRELEKMLREAARDMAREARSDVEIIGDSAIDSPAPSATDPTPPAR